MFIRRLLVVLSVMVVVLPIGALASQTIPSGVGMNTTLQNELDTKNSYVGQPFSLAVVAPYPEGASGLSGATIYGHVAHVQPGGRGRNPELTLQVDKIKYQGGSPATFNAAVTKVTPKKTGHHGARVLGGTLAGMGIGNWIGKSVFGGSAGGAIGATAGFLLSSNNKQDFQVPVGSTVGVQLTSPLTVK